MKTTKPPMKIFAQTANKGGRISIVFLNDRGNKIDKKTLQFPGVYTVFYKNTTTAFYVGEAGNIGARLNILFRCYNNNNPHPCHTFYNIAYSKFPTPTDFCNDFYVEILNTTGEIGRIEIEETKQTLYNTNQHDYYVAWRNKILNLNPSAGSAGSAGSAASTLIPHSIQHTIQSNYINHRQFIPIKELSDILDPAGSVIYVRFSHGTRLACKIGGGNGKPKYINGTAFRNSLRDFSISKGKGNPFSISVEFWNSKMCLNFT